MADLINIMLESTFWLAIFYLAYQMILCHFNWPVFNRFFLLIGLFVSATFPFLQLEFFIEAPEPLLINLGQTLENVSQEAILLGRVKLQSSDLVIPWHLMLYYSVSGLLLTQFLYNLMRLHRFTKNPHLLNDRSYALSFFNFIYIHPEIRDQENASLILRHEKAHAEQWHSLDILLIQLKLIFFWFNPVVWFYGKVIRANHEYLADQAVLNQDPEKKSAYLQAILSLHMGVNFPVLVNNFNVIPYRKRLIMLNKNKISVFKKRFLLLAGIGFLLSVFACKSVIENVEPAQIYTLADLDYTPKKYQGMREIYEYIQKNIIYPAEARKNGVSGKYYISFTADEKGMIYDLAISKNHNGEYLLPEIILIGYGLYAPVVSKFGIKELETDLPPQIPEKDPDIGEQAMLDNLHKLMATFPPVEPVFKNGKPVKVKMVLPLEFKLWPIIK